MDNIAPLDVLFRWIHIGAVIVVLGGSVFMRFVLQPAAQALPDDVHDGLRERLLGRWKKFVHMGILLLLVSGFYNYLVVMVPKHRGDGLYHGLLGTKIILAFGVFFIASALVGRSAAFEKMRQNRKRWLGVIVLLSAIIVGISGFVKVRGPKPAKPEKELSAQLVELPRLI